MPTRPSRSLDYRWQTDARHLGREAERYLNQFLPLEFRGLVKNHEWEQREAIILDRNGKPAFDMLKSFDSWTVSKIVNVHRVGWNSFTFFDIWRVSLPVGLLIALATVNVAWLNEHAHNFFIALRERMRKQKCEANKAGANKHATSYVVGCIEFCHTTIVAARAEDNILMLNVESGVAPYNGYDFRGIPNNAAQALEALDPRIEPNWIITDYEGRCTNEGVGCIVFYNLPYSKAADEGFAGVLHQGPPMKDGKPSTAARPIEILKKGVLGWVYKVAEECADPCKPPLLWKNADFVAPALPIGHSSENTQTGYLTFPAGVLEIARLYADRPFVSTAINPKITSTSDSNSDGHEVHPPLPPSASTPPAAAAAAAVTSSTPERDVEAVAVLHPVIASPVLSPVSEPSEMDIDEEKEEEEDKNEMNEDRPSKRRREYDPAQHFCGSGPCRFPDCPYYKQTRQQSESIVAVTATITATETNENTNIDDKDEEEGARLWYQGIDESDMNTIGGALALLDQEAQDQEAHGLEQALQGGSPVGRPGTPHPSLTPPFDFPTINSDREIDPGTGLFLDELPLGPGWRTPLGQVQPSWQVSNHRGVYVQALPGFCECPVDQFHPALGVGVLRKVLPFETLDELEDEGRYFCQLCQRTRESTASSASAPPATSRPSIHIAKKTNKKIVFKPSVHTGIGE